MKLLIVLLFVFPVLLRAQKVNYDFFKIENSSIIYERVFETTEGYQPTLIKQLKSISGIEEFDATDTLITFYVRKITPQENEMNVIKSYDDNWRILRVHAYAFNGIVYLKSNRYKVVLTSIKDCLTTNPCNMSDITYGLYSPKNEKFRGWSYKYGLTTQNYFSYLFTLNNTFKRANDW